MLSERMWLGGKALLFATRKRTRSQPRRALQGQNDVLADRKIRNDGGLFAVFRAKGHAVSDGVARAVNAGCFAR